jgi:hypothetical protein
MVKHYKFTPKTNLLISTALILVTLGMLVFFGSKVSTASDNVYKQKNKLSDLKNDLATLDIVLEDKNKYQDKVDLVVKSLPASYQDVAFYASQLERIADTQSHTLETTIDKNTKAETDGTSSLKITLNTGGGYSSYSQMLTGLSTLPYHTRVDSIKVDNNGGNVSTLINFRLFVLEDE